MALVLHRQPGYGEFDQAPGIRQLLTSLQR